MSTRKRITELSVAELRTQLNKRGVEAEGDKPTLIAKLKKVRCHAVALKRNNKAVATFTASRKHSPTTIFTANIRSGSPG